MLRVQLQARAPVCVPWLCRWPPLILSVAPRAAPCAEFGPAPDNIRVTHWIGDNQLLLVSYLDKPNVE